jgi:hypothetical protein
MLRKFVIPENVGLKEKRKGRKRVDIAGVKQAMLRRKKEKKRDNIRAFSKKAFLASVSYLL